MPTAFEVHEQTTAFVVYLQGKSKAHQSPDFVQAALYSLTLSTVRAHRAIGVLVHAGWAPEAAVLVRTILDLNVSALAILMSVNPRLAAFKYFYSGTRDVSRDQAYSAEDRRATRAEIQKAYKLLPEADRAAAREALKDKSRAYWFSPEFSGPMELVTKYGIEGMPFIYSLFSSVAHGGYLGGRLYADDPTTSDMEPHLPPGRRARNILLTSSRYVAALLDLRDAYERLGLAKELETLRVLIVDVMKANDKPE